MSRPADRLFGASDALVIKFNALLKQAKSLFPNDTQITELQEVVPSGINMLTVDALARMQQPLEEAKLRTLQLMDILDIEVKERPSTPHQVIQVSQMQYSNQLVTIDLNQLIQAIQLQNVDASTKESAANAVKDFADEIAKPKPDPSKLRQTLDTVAKIGKEFVVPLMLKLLENWDKIFPPKI
jgi:hypothetical protein